MPIPDEALRAADLHLQRTDAIMASLVKAIGPCAMKTNTNRFSTLVNSILSQQISTAAARTIRTRLRSELKPKRITAAALATMSIDQLRECGISRQKANYVLDLAAKVDTGEVRLKTIHRLDDEGVIEELTAVRGIGRWTAQMFLMFCLGRLDVFPTGDLGVQNAIHKHYGIRVPADSERLEEVARPWRPYSTIASWYLWRSLDAGVLS